MSFGRCCALCQKEIRTLISSFFLSVAASSASSRPCNVGIFFGWFTPRFLIEDYCIILTPLITTGYQLVMARCVSYKVNQQNQEVDKCIPLENKIRENRYLGILSAEEK